MFGTMQTAQDWDRLTGTDKGREIFDALRLFHERPITLSPPLPDLEARLKAAAREIGMDVRGVSTVSLAALKRSIDAVPEAMKPYLARDIAGAVQRSLLTEFDDGVREFIKRTGDGPADFHGTIDALSAGISRPHHDHLANVHGSIMAGTSMGEDDLPFPLLGLLVELVEAFCDGRGKDAAALRGLCSLILDGNIPMGELLPRSAGGEPSCVVLTA